MCDVTPTTRPQWKQVLKDLPATPEKIPAFFFAHGQPLLIWPKDQRPSGGPFVPLWKMFGPDGTLAQFLQDFGKTVLDKYKPRAIAVFSAHWETDGQTLVTDYENENPLHMDFYGFPPELYRVQFKSRGDSAISEEIVGTLKKNGISARTSPVTEKRGHDGRGSSTSGLDHGVYMPFIHMFGNEFTEVPIVQISIDGTLKPEKEWALGAAVSELRENGILILAGGLSFHNLGDVRGFHNASPVNQDFHTAVVTALQKTEPAERKAALFDLTTHRGFRLAHPRADHFAPIWVAAGAGGDGETRIVLGEYGLVSVAFGL